MSKLILVANTITGDEKAWAYLELNEMAPDSSGMRRYKIIYVNRDGNIAEYREDMGSVKNFRGKKQLHIPSLWEHSVDELLDMADYLRNETYIDIADWLELDNYKLA